MTPDEIAIGFLLGLARDGVRESGQNRGHWPDAIAHIVGRDPDGAAYCARAVCAAWRIAEIVSGAQLDPRIKRSGSVSRMWSGTRAKAPELCIAREDYDGPPPAVPPGSLMIRLTEHRGHDGEIGYSDGHVEMIVETRDDGRWITVGGNTDAEDAREGQGFFVHDGRYGWADKRVRGVLLTRWIDG